MKKSILAIAILVSGLFVSSMFVAGCGGKKEQSTEEYEHAAGDTTGHDHDEMEMDSTEMQKMDSTEMKGHDY